MTTSPLAQKLDALLTVAESLEGTLPGKTEQEKKHADLNKIFVRIHGNEISMEGKNLLNRLLHAKETYSAEKDFFKLNALYNAIHGISAEELQKALRELQDKGEHKGVSNPVHTLLMCKYRLNAILTHIVQRKETDDDLSRFKITWMPAGSSSLHSMQTRSAYTRVTTGEASKAVKEPKWMTSKTATLQDLMTKKAIGDKEFSSPMAQKRLVYELARDSSGDKNKTIQALKKLPQEQREQLAALCDNAPFKKELSRFVANWQDIVKIINQSLKKGA